MISDIRNALAGKKTYIGAGLLVAVCVAEFFGVDVVPGIDEGNAVTTAWEAMLAITIRAGISAKK